MGTRLISITLFATIATLCHAQTWEESNYSNFEITHEFFTPNGTAASASGGYDMTGYIPVKDGDIIVFSGDRSPGIPFMMGFADNMGNGGSVLLGNFDATDYSNLNVTEEEVTIPAGIAYVRCSARNTSMAGWASRNMSVIKRTRVVFADDTFRYIVRKHGYDVATVNDLTKSSKIKLDEPSCAYVNITGISKMPTKKTDNLHAWLECYDGNGNYFKKRVVLNAQGNSSLGLAKNNIAIDFCEDEWLGEEETDITIGKWVKQSSFHLKANYTSYFRGESQIGYVIYDDIIADRRQPFPWQRAGIEDANGRAVGHPLGFPCYVYLNGQFYGVFAWQLKKHRKNLNLTKELAEHIHLDGRLDNGTLWNGGIDYTKFEIRNPKTLYCTNVTEEQGSTTYAAYDGDSPCELIDESMPYFDANNEGHVLSSRVKKYIQRLSNFKSEIKALVDAKADSSSVRAKMESYFDIQGMTDYVVMSFVTSNGDGFEKNWQWITYDGTKWFVMPYDLDCILGNMWQGTFLFPADVFWYYAKYDNVHKTGPIYYFMRYYGQDVADRYKELRYADVISCSSIMNHFLSWYERVTDEGYNLEYTKWPNSPCNGQSIVSPNWTTSDSYWLTYTWEDYYAFGEFNKARSYNAGDKCTYGGRIWTATTQTQGIAPYTKLAHTDSMERLKSYIDRKLELLDGFFGYDRKTYEVGLNDIPSETEDSSAHVRKYMKDGHLYIIKDGKTYSIDGKRIN